MPRYKYDWDKWFIEGQFTIRKGIDYHVSQSTMHQSIRNNASMRGLRISIEDMGNSFLVNVTGVGKNGISYSDKTTITTKHTSTLEKDDEHKEKTEGGNLLQSTERTVSKPSINSNDNKNRAKKTR